MSDAVLRTAPGYVRRSAMALAGHTTLSSRTRYNSYLWSLSPVACEWANPPGPIRLIRVDRWGNAKEAAGCSS